MPDILDYMLPDQPWALSNHLFDPAKHPLFTTVIKNQIWYIKGAKGFPWDMNTFDDNFIYQSITELTFDNPNTFKIFASPSWPSANGAVAWSPRQYSMNSNGLVTQDSSFRLYDTCTHFTTQNLGGPILTTVEGPWDTDFGGNLGIQNAIVLRYRWGKNLANMEVNHYARKFGWVQWTNFQLQNGQYVQTDITKFNMFAVGGNVQPNFPCQIPTIP